MVVVVLALLLGGCSLVSGPGPRAAASGPSGQLPAAALAEAEREVKNARELIDGYRGDARVLFEARERIERVLREAPLYAPAHVQAARITRALGYWSEGRYDPRALAAALQEVDRAIALDPTHAPAYVLRGYIMLDQKNPAEARSMAERAAELTPDAPYYRMLLAKIDRVEGHLERARQRYVDLLSRAVGTPLERDIWSGLIEVHCGLKDYPSCDAAHQRVIALDPESAWARGNYAHFLNWQGRWDEAIANAEAALRIMDYPNGRTALADAHVGKSWTFIHAARKGDSAALSSAIPHLNVAFETVPDYPQAHFTLGAVLWEQASRATDHAERLAVMTRAAAAFQTARELAPESSYYLVWSARANAELHRLKIRGEPPR